LIPDPKDKELFLQQTDDLQDDAPEPMPQLAQARSAKWPESSYEQGIRRAREILDNGGTLKEPTAKQACFVQAILDGATQAEAYRFAYDCPHDKPSTVNHRAQLVMKNPVVAYELFTQRRRAEERLLRDRTQAQKFVIEHLQRIVEQPGSHHAARVNALGLLGKYAGMFGNAGADGTRSSEGRTGKSLQQELVAKLERLVGTGLVDITPLSGNQKPKGGQSEGER